MSPVSLSEPHPREHRYPCDYAKCDAYRTPETSVEGSFCSTECYRHHKGWKLLKTIRYDHSWCLTCFQPYKEVEPAPSSVTDKLSSESGQALQGYQYPTERTVWATGEKRPPEWHRKSLASSSLTAPIERQTWGCVCGATDHSAGIDEIREGNAEETIQSLWACLNDLHDRDKTPREPSLEPFLDSFREDGFDWELAAYRAVYSD